MATVARPAGLVGGHRRAATICVDVPAHQAECRCRPASGRANLCTSVVTTVVMPASLASVSASFGAELGLAEDGLDAGRLHLVDEGRQLGRRRFLPDVLEYDADELEAEVAGEVREGVVERDELAVRRPGSRRPSPVSSAVERIELGAVGGGVRVERRLAGRVDLGELRRDLRDVVLLHEGRVEPEVGVLLAVLGERRDALAEDEPRRRPAASRREQVVEEVVESHAVRDHELRVAEPLRVVGLGLVVLRADAGRDDRAHVTTRSPRRSRRCRRRRSSS